MLRILFLCHRVPFPPNRGDRIATHRRLLHLAERGRVTCLTFEMERADAASVREIKSLGIDIITDQFRTARRQFAALPWLITNTPMTIRCFASRKLQKAANDFLRAGPGVIVAYSSCMAQFVESARAPRVMEFGDLDSEKWLQYSKETSGISSWVYAREARTLLKYEQRIARTFDSSLVVSKAEAVTFEERTGISAHIVGNGVDLQRFKPDPNINKIPGLIVFTGIMNYLPNVDACVRFATKILPLICKEYPNAKFRIVGAEPSKEILRLASDRVEVTGAVPETADHLRAATVAVAPLRLGRGLQNKVLEAMACAVPIVASANATAGVDARANEHFLLADTDLEFAAAVLKLLHSPELCARLGAAERVCMEERYPWERALQDYDSAIDAAISNYHQKNPA